MSLKNEEEEMFGCKKLNSLIAYQTVEIYRQTDKHANKERPVKKKSAVKGNTRVHV